MPYQLTLFVCSYRRPYIFLVVKSFVREIQNQYKEYTFFILFTCDTYSFGTLAHSLTYIRNEHLKNSKFNILFFENLVLSLTGSLLSVCQNRDDISHFSDDYAHSR